MIKIQLPKISKKVIGVVFLVAVVIGSLLWLYSCHKDEIMERIQKKDIVVSSQTKGLIVQEEAVPETEEIATSQMTDILEEQEDLEIEATEEPDVKALCPVEITDIYAESGEIVEFISYYPNAATYEWEIYDMGQKAWLPADSQSVVAKKDELLRTVSVFQIQADIEKDTSMIRCITVMEDESIQKDTASLFVFPKKIMNVGVDDEELSRCGYVSALEIPVTVTFEDGESEAITGLYGLKFLCSQKTVEYGESVSGNLIEKRIETVTECDYTYLESGENEKIIRYKNLREIELPVMIAGCDKEAPVISDVVIGEYAISKENKPVSVQVEIYAEDNDTPYPYLEYAFAHESVSTDELSFSLENEFIAEIDKNGAWISYVRDQSGNIGELSKEIIAVDQLPPSISVSLQETSWCRKNVIMVSGKDGTGLTYQLMKENECIYDWTHETSFQVTENGNYMVKAKDEAGNETIQEIMVENIDLKAPVITGIKEGE